MPALGEDGADDDEEDETTAGQTSSGAQPVSMPSLDDDGEGEEAAQADTQAATEAAGEEGAGNTSAEGGGVPMEIEDMHTSVEGGEQLKFIVSENGQLLQLDNHILTDAEGNQIIVQGADSEHLQQLLQSVAGLEGGTIQMIQGENNQMILVQQGDNEPQLIDASLLNADGQIVLQQGHATGADGELSQSSEDVAAAAQEQQQYNDAAHDEAVAVLAAAAEQHAAAAAAEVGAVDESSQEDLGAAAEGGAEAAAAAAEATEEEQQPQDESMPGDEDSQAASEAVSCVGGGGGEGEGVASADDGSQEAVEGEGEQMEVEAKEKQPEEEEEQGEAQAAEPTSTGDEQEPKVSSTEGGEEGEKKDFEFFE